MNQKLNIQIKNACNQKFESFHPTKVGGFCNTCDKEVVDFTNMNDKTIFNYFKNNNKNICGHFYVSQLKSYSEKLPIKRDGKFNFFRTGLMYISLFSILSISSVHAQQTNKQEINNDKQETVETTQNFRIIEGYVLKDNEPLQGVNIILKGTTVGTATNKDGKFKFPKSVNDGDILLFNYIGFDTQEVKISKNTPDTLNISMVINDMMMLGEVSTDNVYSSKITLWQKIKVFFE